jgi:hypothetical protein
LNFFEEHHLNHIHEDDRPENKIMICVRCHNRHHKECGYDTVILKKNNIKPKTLEEQMVQIDREEFLKSYREKENDVFRCNIGEQNNNALQEWVKNNATKPFIGVLNMGFMGVIPNKK